MAMLSREILFLILQFLEEDMKLDETARRQYAAFIDYQDPVAKRRSLLVQLRELFDENPIFQDKMWFPNMEKSRLRNLTDKSLKGPHHLCKSPNPNMPDIKTPNVDHSCQQLDDHANNELEPIVPAPAPSTANSDMLWCLPVAGPPNSND